MIDNNSANTVKRRVDASLIEPTVNTTDEEFALPQNEVTNLPKTPLYIKAKTRTHRFLSGKPNQPENDDSSLQKRV